MDLNIQEHDEQNEMVLLHEIASQIRKCFDRRVQHLGLTRSQWRVLCILRRHPGIRQIQLADMMEVEPITLVRLLDRMVKSGWIERKPHPEDRRANQIYLTGKVQGVVDEMKHISISIRQHALDGFTQEEHDVLLRYLERMKTNTVAMLHPEG